MASPRFRPFTLRGHPWYRKRFMVGASVHHRILLDPYLLGIQTWIYLQQWFCGHSRMRKIQIIMECIVLCCPSILWSSAGILRAFDRKVAELPFVVTSRDNRGKGYLKTLLAVIEETLASLKVQTIVLPSTAEGRSMWSDRFGFSNMTAEQVSELKREYFSVVQLAGTTMLSKPISKTPVRVEQIQKDPSVQLSL